MALLITVLQYEVGFWDGPYGGAPAGRMSSRLVPDSGTKCELTGGSAGAGGGDAEGEQGRGAVAVAGGVDRVDAEGVAARGEAGAERGAARPEGAGVELALEMGALVGAEADRDRGELAVGDAERLRRVAEELRPRRRAIG